MLKKFAYWCCFFVFICILVGCGGEEQQHPVVEKQSYIMSMESNMYALEITEADAGILLTEVVLMMMFAGDGSAYEAEVNALQQRFDQIVYDVKTMPLPKDKNAHQLLAIYEEFVVERRQLYNTMFDALLESDFSKLMALLANADYAYEKKFESFQSLWYTYKSS